MNLITLKADLREVILEITALAIIFLVVVLMGLIIKAVKDNNAEKRAILQERRKIRHDYYEAEAMQEVYERYCNDN